MGKFLDAVMNKSIFRLVIIVLLGMFSMAANAAFVSKVINQTSEAMIVTFYNMACQTCQMTVKNANVQLGLIRQSTLMVTIPGHITSRITVFYRFKWM